MAGGLGAHEVARRAGHDVDGAPAVGPFRVGVAVAPEGGPDGIALLQTLAGGRRLRQQLLEVAGLFAGEGLADDALGLGADTGEVAQAVLVGEDLDLVVAHAFEGGSGSPKGAHAIGGLTGPFQQVTDALEGLYWTHGGRLTAMSPYSLGP